MRAVWAPSLPQAAIRITPVAIRPPMYGMKPPTKDRMASGAASGTPSTVRYARFVTATMPDRTAVPRR